MSEQENKPPSLPSRPSIDEHGAWQAYWQAIGQSWRTEPEISKERQVYLEALRSITPDIMRSIYPFKGIKLSRADVEWLLATHEGGHGPVDWSDKDQRERRGLDLRGADLRQVDLSNLPLAGLCGGLTFEEFNTVTVEQFSIARMHLERAYLSGAHLEGAILYAVHLDQANLRGSHLEESNLAWAHLERSILRGAHLEGADLRNVYFDTVTNLEKVILGDEQHGFVLLSNVHWGDVNLSVVDWAQMKMSGDEHEARQRKTYDGKVKDHARRLEEYENAIRANRQLAIVLQAQGLNEVAAHFNYRTQKLQRWVLWQQRSFGQFLFSLLLDLLAGYGYRPLRSLFAYLVVIFGFMSLYLLNAHFVVPHLSWDEALVLSVSSFHGRGFFTQNITLGDTYARLAAAEAIVGLLIEVSLIATFTQRFFGK